MVGDEREALATVVRSQACEMEAWQVAELHLLEQALRCRLDALGVAATSDLAIGLMAVAMLLAQHTAEWGGGSRDSLGEIAVLGLRLLEGEDPGAEPMA